MPHGRLDINTIELDLTPASSTMFPSLFLVTS